MSISLMQYRVRREANLSPLDVAVVVFEPDNARATVQSQIPFH